MSEKSAQFLMNVSTVSWKTTGTSYARIRPRTLHVPAFFHQKASLLDITIDGVKYQIRKLKKEGIINRVGGDRGGHWEVQWLSELSDVCIFRIGHDLSFIRYLFFERDDYIMFLNEKFWEVILLVSHPDTYNEQIPLWYYFGTKSSSKRKCWVEKWRKFNKFA